MSRITAVLARAVGLGGLVLALGATNAADRPPSLAREMPMPAVDAQSLAGTRVQLPADRHGTPFVALFAFSRGGGDQMTQWSNALHERLGDDSTIYAIADLSGVPGLFRGFAVAGIRKAAGPVIATHAGGVLIMSGRNPWSSIVPKASDDAVAVVAVDGDGDVVFVDRRLFAADVVDADASAIRARFGARGR